MKKHELDELRAKVQCAQLLDKANFAVDTKESTRKAVKYRHDNGQIAIVIHDGRGWFDPLSDAKGDVFSLAMHLGAADFPAALQHVADLVGYQPSQPVWTPPVAALRPIASIKSRWAARPLPSPGSASWTYLTRDRFLPAAILQAATRATLLREGPHGSMWAMHTDDAGVIQGWEERGPEWRGFSTEGAKTLLRFGNGQRFCVTEAAIDAFSLAALEGTRVDSCYLSTGGGWSPATVAAVNALARQPGAHLIAATDGNSQGDVYAERLRDIANSAGCPFERNRPELDDWNAVLAQRATTGLPISG